MDELLQGIHRFQQEVFPSEKAHFEQLARGQHPKALFITCSDSRIDPAMLMQTHPGDLFVLRNAGNIIPPYAILQGGEAATIEFALEVLEIPDVVVCGHSRCGAMRALLESAPGDVPPSTQSWLHYADAVKQGIERDFSEAEPERRLTAAIERNVLLQLENLSAHPAVARRLKQGALHLHGWVDRFETGEVLAYDPRDDVFRLMDPSNYRPAR